MIEIKINYERGSKVGIIGGIFVIIATFISLVIIFFVRGYSIIMNDYVILSIPMSLGVGILSIGIALLSCDIADKTDIKIKNLIKAFFMDITYEFEQTKNQIKNSSDKDFRGYQTWRLIRLLERAIHIKDEVDPSLQEDFVKYYCSGPNNLIDGMRFRKNNLHETLGKEEKGNLRGIYNKLKELDLKNIEIEYPSDLIDNKIKRSEKKKN